MAVDQQIDGAQPPSSSRQGEEQGERGSSGSGRGGYLPAGSVGGEGGGRLRVAWAASGHRRRSRRRAAAAAWRGGRAARRGAPAPPQLLLGVEVSEGEWGVVVWCKGEARSGLYIGGSS